MTKGNPAQLIFSFAIPLMLGNVFQQIYTITDSLIVSRSLGMNALAALGSADWFDYMIITIIQAAAQGFAIQIAQDFGAGQEAHLQKAVAHSIYLCVVIAVIMTGIAVLLIEPMLIFLAAPKAIAWMTKEYLLFKFAGLSCSMLLNYNSALLRAFGNSRTPLYAMVTSAAINIILDLFFVCTLHSGIGGAAIATVIAQGLGGVICLPAIFKIKYIHLSRDDFRPEKGLNRRLISLSVPMVLQNILISFGGLIVQSRVNTYPMTFIAGYTATNKLYGALELAAIAYGFAMVTYIGQNYGAARYERIYAGLKASLWIALATSAVVSILMILFGQTMTGWFLNGDAVETAEANAYAYRFLCILAICLPILYILYIMRSTLQGLGNTIIPMISGIAEFLARIFMVLIAVKWIGEDAMFWAEIAAWSASDIVLISTVYKSLKELKKNDTTRKN